MTSFKDQVCFYLFLSHEREWTEDQVAIFRYMYKSARAQTVMELDNVVHTNKGCQNAIAAINQELEFHSFVCVLCA